MDGSNQELPPQRVELPNNTAAPNPEGIHPVDSTSGKPVYIGESPYKPTLPRRNFLVGGLLAGAAALFGLSRQSGSEPTTPQNPEPATTTNVNKPAPENSNTNVSTTSPRFPNTNTEQGRLESQLPSAKQVYSQPYTAGTNDLGNFPSKK